MEDVFSLPLTALTSPGTGSGNSFAPGSLWLLSFISSQIFQVHERLKKQKGALQDWGCDVSFPFPSPARRNLMVEGRACPHLSLYAEH